MVPEGLVENGRELGHPPVLGDLGQRDDLVTRALDALERAVPALHEVGPHLDLVVDPALLGFEAGVLQEGVVVGRVLVDEHGR